MHYKNGREAKNGDKVVLFSPYGGTVVGILYDAVAGNDTCNGRIAPTSVSDPCPIPRPNPEMSEAARAARRQALDEIIQGYDQLIELFQTGGQARLTGHAYDPKEKDREIALLQQLKEGVTEMRDAS